jgi:hypothetical protein
VKENLSDSAEKGESAWIVTEHLSNTAKKWESAWIATEHVKYCRKMGISKDCDRTSVKD